MSFHAVNDPASGDPVVSVENVWCSYGDFTAVRDVSFSVPRGSIHALLGTNGAGKTTLLETVQGFRRPARGGIDVLGFNPARERTRISARTGTMLQESGLVDEMTVSGQLDLWRGLNLREDSTDRVLELVGLTHRRHEAVSVLSGGERRRLDFAMALWGHPELMVLDEPTTGLDPQSRRMVWRTIRDVVSSGTAVLLTTHYLDEAQSLAETVTILDRGRVAREGPMERVLATIPATISFSVPATGDTVDALATRLDGDLEAASGTGGTHVRIRTSDLQVDVGKVIDWGREHALALDGLRSSPASLEEVFLDVADAGGRETTGERTNA